MTPRPLPRRRTRLREPPARQLRARWADNRDVTLEQLAGPRRDLVAADSPLRCRTWPTTPTPPRARATAKMVGYPTTDLSLGDATPILADGSARHHSASRSSVLVGRAPASLARRRRRRQPMTPARRRSQSCVARRRGADSMDRTKQSELRVMDGVRTGGLPRAMTEGF